MNDTEMEICYTAMDDLLEIEFELAVGVDILGKLRETYRDSDDSDAVQLAAFIKGYIQSVDENLNKIIRFLDNATLSYADEKRMRKKNDEKRENRLHTITTDEAGDRSESSGGTVGVSADAGERTEDRSE